MVFYSFISIKLFLFKIHIRMKNRKFVINATNLYKIVCNAYLLPNALNALINIIYTLLNPNNFVFKNAQKLPEQMKQILNA